MIGQNEKETAKTLKKTIKSLENVKNQLFTNLTEEQLKAVAPVSADFSRVMNAAKNGNTEELNKYVAKYANIN